MHLFIALVLGVALMVLILMGVTYEDPCDI